MSLTIKIDIARIAATEYRSRHRRAHEAVRAGQMDIATATGHLRPWLAIACLAGADLPELEDGLADLRNYQVIWPFDRAGQNRTITEGEARDRLALDICPRSRWTAILIAARNRALDRLTRPEPAGDGENTAAASLVHLANHFRLPGWRPRTLADDLGAFGAAGAAEQLLNAQQEAA